MLLSKFAFTYLHFTCRNSHATLVPSTFTFINGGKLTLLLVGEEIVLLNSKEYVHQEIHPSVHFPFEVGSLEFIVKTKDLYTDNSQHSLILKARSRGLGGGQGVVGKNSWQPPFSHGPLPFQVHVRISICMWKVTMAFGPLL